MKKIFKYKLELRARGSLELPEGADILTARFQNSTFGSGLMIWAAVNPEARKERKAYAVLPTGEEVPEGLKYLATVETPSDLIFHVYIEA